MFVPIMLLSTRRQSHGLTSDRASMCTHTYTYNDDFIGNGCWWSIASQVDVQHVDKGTERNRRTDERRRKVLAIGRILANMCMFDTIPIFQSIMLIPNLSLFLYFDIRNWSQNDRTMKYRIKRIDTYMYIRQIAFSLLIQVYMRALTRSR